MTITDSLVKVLACPKCRHQITYEPQKNELICDACKLSYPIRDQIPVMLVDEAESCG